MRQFFHSQSACQRIVQMLLMLLCFCLSLPACASTWSKLQETHQYKLLLDKQSILQRDQYKRAWVKIEYKVPQKSQNTAKEFNLSKLLWYFDCPAQKAATSQVFQYLDSELVYSIAIEPKSAEFIEPVPETEIDIAMRYVCLSDKSADPASKPSTEKPADKATEKVADKPGDKAAAKPAAAAEKPSSEKPDSEKPAPEKAAAKTEKGEAKPDAAIPDKAKSKPEKSTESAKGNDGKPHWAYEGKTGPDQWGKLSSEFALCDSGRNQSPVNIENTIKATLPALKALQLSPVKEILNNGRTVQITFKEGNLLLVDGKSFQMKQLQFHSPSENALHGVDYPLEAHFVHADPKGNLAVLGVMFKEGPANPGLTKLWQQLPMEAGESEPVTQKVLPGEMLPAKRSYYRFSGSLTTPPCSEGVTWLMLKNPMTASKAQIEAFRKAVKGHNNRPVQPLNGRVVLE